MNGSSLSIALTICEPVLGLTALICVLTRKCSAQYNLLSLFLVCHLASTVVLAPLFLFGGYGIDRHLAYSTYFWIYWIGFALEAVISLFVIYNVFCLAMAPLDGIRRLGVLVFRWAICMSLLVVSASILLPHPSEKAFFLRIITEVQRIESVLTLCLLFFVCFAIRLLGLSYRSRLFGVILGLGILATTKLVAFGWMAYSKQLYSFAGVVDSAATCVALLVWIGYFAFPEAERKIVILPTTSPFLRWNQISQALGSSSGFVAVGGVPPEMFASAELEIMRRASINTNQPAFTAQTMPSHKQSRPA